MSARPGPPEGAAEPLGAIWAQDRQRVLGADGGMLWRVPADFRHFKAATLGGAVLMGRTTWKSIGGALPGRLSIVLSRRAGWSAPGALTASSLQAGLGLARQHLGRLGEDPREGAYRMLPRLWVIGGGTVYQQAMDAGVLDELVVTTVDLGAGRGPAVRAPVVDPALWVRDEGGSDAPGLWRPVSGDARWRVDHWLRA